MKLGPSLCGVELRSVTVGDVPFILSLRMDPSRNQYISRTSSRLEDQNEWICDYIEREKRGEEYYFIILQHSQPSGTVRLYDFQRNSFSWGSWIIMRGSDPGISVASAIMVYDFGFDQLGFEQSHFDVQRANGNVVRFHSRMGAEIVGGDDVSVHFIFTKDIYQHTRSRMVAMLGG
jgi:hypothetical protein